MSFQTDVELLHRDVILAHNFIHGPVGGSIVTEGGTLRTLAGTIGQVLTWQGVTTETTDDIADLVTAIGSTVTSLVVTTHQTLGANLVLPANIQRLVVLPGGLIDLNGFNLTVNGTLVADWYQIFTGTGNVTCYYHAKPDWWGGKGNNSTESGAAINKAILAIGGRGPVLFRGIYCSSVAIAANTVHTYLLGLTPGYVYGPTSSPCAIKFTAALPKGIYTDVDGTPYPYINLENLGVDGNGLVDVGFEGGYVSAVKQGNFCNCLVAGMKTSTQTTTIDRCGFNGNYDGLVINSGTVTVENCALRQNTRHGCLVDTGTGTGIISFKGTNIIESNGGRGLKIFGPSVNVYLGPGTYFEENDLVLHSAPNRYHTEIETSSFQDNSEGVVFDNCYAASGEPDIKMALVTSGNVKFRDCCLVGDITQEPVTITSGDVVFENSFLKYPKISSARILPEPVVIDPASALSMTINGYIDVSASSLSFGSGSFSLSLVYAPNTSANTNRILTFGATNGFTLGALGDAGSVVALTTIYFAKTGAAAFHTTPALLRNSIPSHLVYVRASGVGYLYLNNRLMESFVDTNDYSGIQDLIGHSSTGPDGKVYQVSFFSAALTAAQVRELWKAGGNAKAAGLSNITLQLMMDKRVAGAIHESVTDTDLTLTNSTWLCPSTI